MKYMVISDIHGRANYLQKALEIFNKNKFDRLICLGDYLYHGPRNPLDNNYDPMKCVELLKNYQDKLIKIRGNCDADIDEELLERNFVNELILEIGNKKYLFTHGHKINENNYELIKEKVDYIFIGHFHVQKNIKVGEYTFVSPGSISLPKENSKHGYIVIDEQGFKTYDLESEMEI